MHKGSLLISLGLLSPAAALADEPVNTVTIYLLGIGIDGHATAGPLTADIDVSASEVLESLEFGAMGSYRRDTGPWSFQIDAMYASLAGEKQGPRGLGKATLGERWSFVARGDIGGFGIGSDLTWHATAHFDWQVTERVTVLFAYRIFDLDFDDGGGTGHVALDLQESGPGIGAAFSF